MNQENSLKNTIIMTSIIVFGSLICLILLICILFGFGYIERNYQVWASGMRGKAQLQQAEWNRQIIVREAEARKDSAIYLAQAEIERAKGVAQANKIIGDSLKGNEDYLRYLWIDHLQNEKNQVIYVPTEANLPILESQRLKGK
jgi:regulator of protease activity HflC (stomatin/prohibitin superfamily)